MTDTKEKANFGVRGLDDITVGGLARGRLFLLEGSPGTGKTTIATQFLMAGAAAGERVALHHLVRNRGRAARRARRRTAGRSTASTFSSWCRPKACSTTNSSRACFIPPISSSAKRPSASSKRSRRSSRTRVVLDSLSEIRLLAQSSLRYRRQILALKHYFARSGATVLMLDDLSSEANDRTMHSVAHGVIRLEELSPEYGAERRRLRVIKYRGQRYRGGYHDFVIAHRRRARLPAARLGRAPHDVQARGAGDRIGRSSTRCSAAASSAVRAC